MNIIINLFLSVFFVSLFQSCAFNIKHSLSPQRPSSSDFVNETVTIRAYEIEKKEKILLGKYDERVKNLSEQKFWKKSFSLTRAIVWHEFDSIKTYEDLVNTIDSHESSSDYYLDVFFEKKMGKVHWRAIAAIPTLSLIPAHESPTYRIKMTLIDRHKNQIRTCQSEDRVSYDISIFAFSGTNPESFDFKIYDNLINDCFSKLLRKQP